MPTLRLTSRQCAHPQGNFIAFSGSVCAELDQKHHEWIQSGNSAALAKVDIDITGRIASTGNEQKATNKHTGSVFSIDLANLKQINKR